MRHQQQAEKEEQQRIKNLVLNLDLRDENDGPDGGDPLSYPLQPNLNKASRNILPARSSAVPPSYFSSASSSAPLHSSRARRQARTKLTALKVPLSRSTRPTRTCNHAAWTRRARGARASAGGSCRSAIWTGIPALLLLVAVATTLPMLLLSLAVAAGARIGVEALVAAASGCSMVVVCTDVWPRSVGLDGNCSWQGPTIFLGQRSAASIALYLYGFATGGTQVASCCGVGSLAAMRASAARVQVAGERWRVVLDAVICGHAADVSGCGWRWKSFSALEQCINVGQIESRENAFPSLAIPSPLFVRSS